MEAKSFIDRMSREQISSLIGSWAWIVADRTGGFQEFLGRPMTKWDAIRERTKFFIAAKQVIPGDASDQIAIDLMRSLLHDLASDGEDVPRMLTWAMSLDDVVFFGSPPNRWNGSERDWDEEITSWKHWPDEDVRHQLYGSFSQQVLEPRKRIREARMAGLNDKDDCCEDPSLRSEWDQIFVGLVSWAGLDRPGGVLDSGLRRRAEA